MAAPLTARPPSQNSTVDSVSGTVHANTVVSEGSRVEVASVNLRDGGGALRRLELIVAARLPPMMVLPAPRLPAPIRPPGPAPQLSAARPKSPANATEASLSPGSGGASEEKSSF